MNPYDRLTAGQRAVYALLDGNPAGLCRRDFAQHDIFEVANRITEIEDRLGIKIGRERCTAHYHRRRIVRYML